jgi:hypothetical protein
VDTPSGELVGGSVWVANEALLPGLSDHSSDGRSGQVSGRYRSQSVKRVPGLDIQRDGMVDMLYAARLKSGGVGGRPWSMAAVHHVHTQLGKLLKTLGARDSSCATSSLLADALRSATRDRAPDMTVWTPDELRRLLTFADGYRAGPMVHVAAMTGMRRGRVGCTPMGQSTSLDRR